MAAKQTDTDDDAGVLSGVSTSQVVGSALAAVTAAVAGSWLGVAGTLIGAAVGSIVATIAGSIYTNSIRKSRQLAQAARLTSLATLAKRDPRTSGGTTVLPVPEALDAAGQPGDGGVEDVVDSEATAEAEVAAEQEALAEEDAASKRPITWRGVAAAAVVSLVLALGGIWAYEAVVGHPLGNSEKSGTTFSNVRSGDDGGSKTDNEPEAPSESSPTDSPESTEPTPTDEASPSEETTPSESTPSTEPTPDPAPSVTPTPDSGSETGGTDEDPSLGQSTPAPTDVAPTPSSVDG